MSHSINLIARSSSKRLYSSRASKAKYDAVIVGGGHNGLVSAAYLAKSGKSVCVLERREVVGGAAVTEEIVPGYKFSRCSYVLSLLRPQIYKDLELKRHGLHVYLRDPSSYTPLRPEYQTSGGPTSLTLGSDAEKNREQIARFSLHDSLQYEKYEEQLSAFKDVVEPLLDAAPADLNRFMEVSLLKKLLTLGDVTSVREAAKAALRCDTGALYELVTAPCNKVLNKWFVSEPLKATLATDAVIGAMGGPNTPGGGYVLLHHIMGELEGIRGAWGYPRGGMGAVSESIASAAREAGAEIVTGASVKSIVVENGKAVGVTLDDSNLLRADMVLSNASPKVTFLDLMGSADLDPEYRRAVQHIDYKSPVTKINVAVNKLPNFLADPNVDPNVPMPHHRATIHLNCENSEMLEDAYRDAKGGRISKVPMMEMTIPSSLDDSLAPPGHHVCLFFTQYTPYNLESSSGWDEQTKEDYANVIFNTVETYAPGFKESIVGKEVLSPPDLERIFGLTGGNIFHGSMSLDQLFLTRPVASSCMSPGTPVDGLLLCGSGAHPGGGVMGAPGRIAAKEALRRMGSKWRWQ